MNDIDYYGDMYAEPPMHVEEGIQSRVKRSARKSEMKNCETCKGNHQCCDEKRCLLPKGSKKKVKDIVSGGNGCCNSKTDKNCKKVVKRIEVENKKKRMKKKKRMRKRMKRMRKRRH